MDQSHWTLGDLRARTVDMPDSVKLVVNVNHGDDYAMDLRAVISVDVSVMSVEPFGEVIFDCEPYEG